MRYEQRRKVCVRSKILDDPKLREIVQTKIIAEHWSPEQIAGRLLMEWKYQPVSYSTIYRAIHRRELDTDDLRKTKRGIAGKLRHKGKRRRTKDTVELRGKIPNVVSIDERPAVADLRRRLGDWEGDTIVGKPGGACLVTLVDRTSGFLVGGKAQTHTAADVSEVEIAALIDQPRETLTLDRGKEFAKHEEVSKALDLQTYFALPHHPWQRGTNENTNGLLREYFPKGTNFNKVSNRKIKKAYDSLNRRPRKRLWYLSPEEFHHYTRLHLI